MKKFLLIGTLAFALAIAHSADAQSLGGPTYQQSVFGNTPTYAQTQSSAQAVSSSGGSCSNLATTGLSGLVGCIIGVFNNLVYLMMAGAVVVIVWGAFQMIYSEEKRDSAKQTIYHGIIGLFVMISIWGLVNILDKTFNLRGTPISPPPLTR